MSTPSPRRGRRPHPHRAAPVRVGRARAALPALLLVLGAACASSGAAEGGGADSPPASSVAAPPTTEAPASEPGTPAIGTRPATLDRLPAAAPDPVRLEIPAIGVDVAVRPVGVEGDGDMEVPPPEEAGWYRHGPRPGADGSSVIAAHVDWDGRAAAFFRLSELAPGDEVRVTMADGAVVTHVVTGSSQVAKDDLAASGAFARDGGPRLALITCGGEFDRGERSYRDNVVVHAEPFV